MVRWLDTFLYELFAGLGFGISSLFSFLGGGLGDHLPKKPIIIIGYLGILLLVFSGIPTAAFLFPKCHNFVTFPSFFL